MIKEILNSENVVTDPPFYNIWRKGLLEIGWKIKNEELRSAQIGSLTYVLWGPKISNQSIVIRVGIGLEKFLNELQEKQGLQKYLTSDELVEGHQTDSLYIDTCILKYKEQKCNIILDSEKTKATINKVSDVHSDLLSRFDGDVDSCILASTVWSLEDAPKLSTMVNKCNNKGVKVMFMKEFFTELELEITKDQFYSSFRELGMLLNA